MMPPQYSLSVNNSEFTDKNQDAAVVLISDRKHILLIRRIEREDDPWSGQIAFPGGFRKSSEDLRETARRETLEEVGILPDLAGFIGTYLTYRGEKRVAVFYSIIDDEPKPKKGPEVDDIHWVPLTELKTGKTDLEYPSLDYWGGQIWGLTYRILIDNIREIK